MTAWSSFRYTLRSVMGDEAAVLSAILGGIAYCFFYPLPYLPEVVRDLPVVVADYDASPLSRQLERNLDATREVRVVGVTRTVEDAVPRLQSGDIGGIVVVPPDFDRDVLRGAPTGVTVMGNGGYVVVDGTVLTTSVEALGATVVPALGARLVESGVPIAAVAQASRAGPALVKQPMFNTVQGYASYVVPASTGLIVHQLMVIAICVVMGTWIERGRWAIAENGTLSPAAFFGMIGAFSVIAFGAVLFWIGFVFWFHDLPRAGNLAGGIATGAVYAIAIAGIGVCIGCWMADRERAFQVIGALSVPLLFLTGFAFPAESIGQPLIGLSFLLPTTSGVQALLKFNQIGASFREAEPEMVRLTVVAVVYVGVAWWVARRRAATSGALPVAVAAPL